MVRRADNNVRVRIAPSPTGFAHVGTAYSALFNYAFAKANSGKFVLRLEDTDVKREVSGAEEAIYTGLAWLGLSWDEGPDKDGKYGPYRQSERLRIYQKKAKELEVAGLAYKEDGAIRFKNPGEDIGWKDLVRGSIAFPGDQITDFVILKSDGFPTYNFAVVIDDLLMKISHVIRGEEHISNTPRQLVLYKAFGAIPPEFAHLPTLRNIERKKLSKRRDPVDLRIYQKEGYLPEALINFLCLLGWSHPEEKEIFSLEEFIKLFDLSRVRPAGPVFNIKKLDWINGEYIRKFKIENLKLKIFEFFKGKYPEDRIREILPLVQSRIKTLKEFEEMAGFFFERRKPAAKLFGKKAKNHLQDALAVLENVEKWEKDNIDKALLGIVEEKSFKTGDFFMDLRVAVAGSRFTPPINDSIFILGKKETLARLKKAI